MSVRVLVETYRPAVHFDSRADSAARWSEPDKGLGPVRLWHLLTHLDPLDLPYQFWRLVYRIKRWLGR